MISHYHGQIINYSELSRSFGIADTTVRQYLDILSETFMIRQLRPWYENIKKRQVKRQKLYFKDSGIYHSLLMIESKKSLISHPKLGASWEGFALNQVISHFQLEDDDIYFWNVHQQGGLDLFFQKNGKRYGVEFKFNNPPYQLASINYTIKHLRLNHVYYIYPGEKLFSIKENIIACGLKSLKKLTL